MRETWRVRPRARPRSPGRSMSACAPWPAAAAPTAALRRSQRLGPPDGGLGRRYADGDQDRAALTHGDASPRERPGRGHRLRVCVGADFGGSKGPPLASPRVIHGVCWLRHLKGARQPCGKRAGRLPAAGISGRRNLHTLHGEARPKRCQQPESRRFPKASSVVPRRIGRRQWHLHRLPTALEQSLSDDGEAMSRSGTPDPIVVAASVS